jgi:hypothetical protein
LGFGKPEPAKAQAWHITTVICELNCLLEIQDGILEIGQVTQVHININLLTELEPYFPGCLPCFLNFG